MLGFQPFFSCLITCFSRAGQAVTAYNSLKPASFSLAVRCRQFILPLKTTCPRSGEKGPF